MAERAHILCIPKGRWLIQNRQELPAFLYLARGKVQTFSPDQVLRSSPHRGLEHFYPGCTQARALQTSQILRIDAAQRSFLLNRAVTPEPVSLEHNTEWLQRFLRTHMMQQLSRQHWQVLIDAFVIRQINAGCEFIRQGDSGRQCYVVESGHGVVHRNGKTLAHLGPGDFFGEDALITGAHRSASVSALDNMLVHAVDKTVFVKHVLHRLVEVVSRPGLGQLLNLDPHCRPDAQPFSIEHARDFAQQMDPRRVYYIVGGTSGERALCAFLLVKRGFQARPLR